MRKSRERLGSATRSTKSHGRSFRQVETGSPERRTDERGLARRELLQAGVLGVAGSVAAVAAASAQAPAIRESADCEPAKQPPPEIPCPDARPLIPPDPETWNEPWVWRPGDWPGQQLDLNIVENQNPGVPVGLGNPGSVLFSYGGDTPGPTIRMKGDETLFVKLRNLLGQDFGKSFVGAYPHVADAPQGSDACVCADAKATALGNDRDDFCLGEHTNGVHSIRVTNLHTHGLHVRPGRNPDGSHSDNVILRLLSQGDFRRREREGPTASCDFLRDPEVATFTRDDELVGEADYEFRLGDVQRRQRVAKNCQQERRRRPLLPPQPHPAGTFWYHPHAHGATHNQVASGMAGFLLVEGDIEESINRVLVGWTDADPVPDPSLKTGPYDYRERLMLIQRALNTSADKDASKRSPGLQGASAFQPLVNGGSTPSVIRMTPGAIERLRVLNGSVDGRGYKRLMVVKGQFTVQKTPNGNFDTYEVLENGELSGPFGVDRLEELEARKQDLHQLSIDGVTLVKQGWLGERCERLEGCDDGDCPEFFWNKGSKYYIKPLAGQNAGTENPLWTRDAETWERLCRKISRRDYPAPCSRDNALKGADLYSRLVNVWKGREHVKNCFVRPNEFYMGPANRTDVFFQAPAELGRTYRQAASGAKCPPRTGPAPRGCPPSPKTQPEPIPYEIYTVLARTVLVHSDTPLQNAQKTIATGQPLPAPEDVVIAWILVEGGDGGAGRKPIGAVMEELEEALPPVQQYLQPVCDEELEVCPDEVAAREDCRAGDYRTRRILYSGWGHPNMPLVSTEPGVSAPETVENFKRFIERDQRDRVSYKCKDANDDEVERTEGRFENLIYTENPRGSGHYVLLAPEIRTMAISVDNPRTEEEKERARRERHLNEKQLAMRPWVGARLPRKFDPNDPYRARMLENTAEQWTLYNLTNPLFGNTDPDCQPESQYNEHFVSYPIERGEGQRCFLENFEFQLTAKGIDHPFHVHQNPFWVSRIEIPDENGDLVNILDEPRWMDSIWIPRNRGRVVFRMRFPDYVGVYVHHCHILLHEDNGMMHAIEATPFADEANFRPSRDLDPAERPSPEESYTRSYTFVDPSPATGQVYPGFEVRAPEFDGSCACPGKRDTDDAEG